jgi:hypothetical protein
MIAQSHPTPYSDPRNPRITAQADADQGGFVHEPDIEPPASLTASHGPVDGAPRESRSMLPQVSAGMVAGGAAAILGGGAVGFWLGRRSVGQRRAQVRKTAASVSAAAGLVPVAVQLLANPLVRALVLRMLVRKISPRALS